MKKEFKRAISKILAGTMLITSSFAGTVVVNATETPKTVMNLTFDGAEGDDAKDFIADGKLNTDSSKAIYGKAISDAAAVTGTLDYVVADGVLEVQDNSADATVESATVKGESAMASFKVASFNDNKSVSEKYEVTGKFNISKGLTSSSRDFVNLENGSVGNFARIGVTKVNNKPALAVRLQDLNNVKHLVGFVKKASGNTETELTANTDYFYKFAVDPANKTINFYFGTSADSLDEYVAVADVDGGTSGVTGTSTGDKSITSWLKNVIGEDAMTEEYFSLSGISVQAGNTKNKDEYVKYDDIKVVKYESGTTPVEPVDPDETTSPAAFTLTTSSSIASQNLELVISGGAFTNSPIKSATGTALNEAYKEGNDYIVVTTASGITAEGIAASIKALKDGDGNPIVNDAVADGEKVTVTINNAVEAFREMVFYVRVATAVKENDEFEFTDGTVISIAAKGGHFTKIEGSDVSKADLNEGTLELKSNAKYDINKLHDEISKKYKDVTGYSVQIKDGAIVVTTPAETTYTLVVTKATEEVKADGFTYEPADGKIKIVAAEGKITDITGTDVKEKTVGVTAKVTLTKDSTLTAASIASGINALDKVTATEASGVITITTEKGTTITLTVEKKSDSSTVNPPIDGTSIDITGTADEAVSTDATKPVYATVADIAKYTANGIKVKAPASGNGKLVFDFGKKATKLVFETVINASQTDFGTVELQGKSAGREGDLIVVNNNGGFYQFAVRTGGDNNQFISDTAVIVGQDVRITIEVDLVNDTAKALVNGVQLKNADGDISLAAASTVADIEYIDKAAYFVKNGVSQEVSSAKYKITEEATTQPSDLGTIDIKKTAVGTANINDLKPGDQVDVTYSLSDKVVGINNYTFFVDWDPKVLTLVGAQPLPADATLENNKVVGYYQSGVGFSPLIPVELINGMGEDKGQMDVTPSGDNLDYANCSTADGMKADGTIPAKLLGRIKLAGVAGLAGYNEANTSEKTPWATSSTGILFTIRFTVNQGADEGFGSFPEIGLTPVGSTAGKFDLFFGVPKDGTGSDVIKVDETNSKVDEVVEIPGTSDLFDFSYVNDTLGVKIVVANGVLDTDFGTSVKDFSKGVMTLTKESDTTVAQVIADMLTAGKVTGATVAADGEDGVILTSTADTTKTMSIKFAKEQKEPDPGIQVPEPLGFTFNDAALGVSFTVSNGAIVGTSFGDNIKENTGTPTAPVLVIKEGAPETVTPEAIINAIVGANLGEGVTATAGTGSVTIKNEDGSSITIKFAKEGEPPVGDTTFEIKITDAAGNEAVDLTAVVDGNGLNVTTGTGKGPVKKTDDGAIAPVITKVVDTDPTNNVDTTALATENFTVKGAKSFNYDVDTMTLNLVDAADKTYKLQLYVGGDFNDDGTAGVSDALKIIAFANENPSIVAETTDRNKVAGDVNLDEDLGLSDALQIVAFANEKLAEFPMFTE